MDPRFNTSFIPKKPAVDIPSSPGSYHTTSVNIFSVLAGIIFTVAVLGAVGVFGYKIMLKNQISAAGKEIDAARNAFEVDKIKELITAN